MSLGIISTKRRIRSVESTRKITKAMELVSTSKLKRCRDIYDKSNIYTNDVLKMTQEILAFIEDKTSIYTDLTREGPKLYIVVFSNLGLCGGYNANVSKCVKEVINKDEDKLIVIGLKGINTLVKQGYNVIHSIEEDTTGHEQEVSKELSLLVKQMYENNEISQVKFIYTKFVNSLTFIPECLTLLPINPSDFKKEQKSSDYAETQFEPNAQLVLDNLLPLYFESTLFGKLVESHVSEQASRRTAMENATDNADEIRETLLLQYNKARQGAITQEITEVVAGANAS